MGAFIYTIGLQWKLDLRNKGIILVYYVVPLVFFGFMGAVFSSINPEAKATLIQSMSIFAITMGAILGAPAALIDLYGSETKKAYKVGNVPLWMAAVSNFISAFIHIFIVNLIIFIVSPIVFDASLPKSIPLYFMSVTLYISISLLIGTILGLCVKNTSRQTMLAQLIFLPSIMISGIMFDAKLLPKAFQYISNVFPATHAMRMMNAAVFDIKMFLPMLIITIIALIINVFILIKISLE